MKLLSLLFSAVVVGALPSPAYAHWGHVGELAGHAHVLGIGALAAAAALAAALLLPEAEEEEADDDEQAFDPAEDGEVASA